MARWGNDGVMVSQPCNLVYPFSTAVSRRALARVELIVLAVVGVLLLSLLTPALGVVRQEMRHASCVNNLSLFGRGMHCYAMEHEGWLPGVNTSGLRVSTTVGIAGMLDHPEVPVQTYDWMTPVLSYVEKLPANRAQRFWHLWYKYRCPQQTETAIVAPYFMGFPSDDYDEFVELAEAEPWPACSYLMSAHFSWWGRDYEDYVLGPHLANPSYLIRAFVASDNWETVNYDYVSRLDQVGPPDRKLFVADGTRYISAGRIIDFNPSPDPRLYGVGVFGAFASSGAWWAGSTTYGVGGGTTYDGYPVTINSPSQGYNLSISYRHRTCGSGPASTSNHRPGRPGVGDDFTGSAQDNYGCINAVMFDGHVTTLDDRESRNPVLWYPTGTIVNENVTPGETMTTLLPGSVIP